MLTKSIRRRRPQVEPLERRRLLSSATLDVSDFHSIVHDFLSAIILHTRGDDAEARGNGNSGKETGDKHEDNSGPGNAEDQLVEETDALLETELDDDSDS